MSTIQRLYIKHSLQLGAEILLGEYHSNYLTAVLRLKDGMGVLLFNEIDGEVRGIITKAHKKKAVVLCQQYERRPVSIMPEYLGLAFAPIKNPTASFIVQKATELGVTDIHPVITERTVVRKLNVEKLSLAAVEATEQTMRFLPPTLHQVVDLEKFLAENNDKVIIFCDEKATKHCLDVLQQQGGSWYANKVRCMVLIGPEGGFSSQERKLLLDCNNVLSVSIHSNILRAETAIIAVLTLVYSAILYGMR